MYQIPLETSHPTITGGLKTSSPEVRPLQMWVALARTSERPAVWHPSAIYPSYSVLSPSLSMPPLPSLCSRLAGPLQAGRIL